MELSFPSNKQVELSFKVGVAGTSSAPQNVSVALEKNGKSLSYAASKDGDDWKAVIDNPGHLFGEGEVNIAVHVLLNNRLFSPFKGIASIIGEPGETKEVQPEQPTDDQAEVPAEETPSVEPAEEPAPEVKVTVEEPEEVEEPLPPTPVLPTVAPVKPKKYESLLKIAEKAIPAPVKPEVKPLPKPAEKKPVSKPVAEKKPISIPVPKVSESVTISAPVKMQLLKSIEPGRVETKVKKVTESVNKIQSGPIFKIKRSKIIYK